MCLHNLPAIPRVLFPMRGVLRRGLFVPDPARGTRHQMQIELCFQAFLVCSWFAYLSFVNLPASEGKASAMFLKHRIDSFIFYLK